MLSFFTSRRDHLSRCDSGPIHETIFVGLVEVAVLKSVIITQQISCGIVYTERELIVEARDESGHPYRRGGEEVTANMLDCSMKDWFPTYDTVDKGNGSYVVKA